MNINDMNNSHMNRFYAVKCPECEFYGLMHTRRPISQSVFHCKNICCRVSSKAYTEGSSLSLVIIGLNQGGLNCKAARVLVDKLNGSRIK